MDLPDLEALFLKLHELAHFAEARSTLINMVKNIYIIKGSVHAWETLKGLFRLPGFADGLIAGLIEVYCNDYHSVRVMLV